MTPKQAEYLTKCRDEGPQGQEPIKVRNACIKAGWAEMSSLESWTWSITQDGRRALHIYETEYEAGIPQ